MEILVINEYSKQYLGEATKVLCHFFFDTEYALLKGNTDHA